MGSASKKFGKHATKQISHKNHIRIGLLETYLKNVTLTYGYSTWQMYNQVVIVAVVVVVVVLVVVVVVVVLVVVVVVVVLVVVVVVVVVCW
jgi:hypothetical protein